MILYPNALALSEPLSNTRIGYQTYTRDVVGLVTASTESADGPKDAPLRPDTFEAWAPTALPATWKYDMLVNRDVDYVAVGGHNLGSKGSGLLVETSTDDAIYTTFASSVAPGDDAALMFLDTLRSARYVRLTVSGSALSRISTISIGQVLKMQRHVSGGYAPITMSRETVLHQSMSRGGQFLGQNFRRNGLKGDIAFKNLTASWVRSSFDPFVKAARQYPYFLAWNPLEFPYEVGYVWTEKDIVAHYSGMLDLMDAAWQMRGVGNV